MKGFLCMGFPGCLGGTTLHTLKLATVPSSSIFFRSSYPPPPPTTLLLSHRLFPKAKSPSSFLFRAISSTQTALQTPSIAPQEEKGAVSKPQWRAAIDFKWIRDNRDAVASNINNRNSNVDLELVLDLYDKSCTLQKEVERLRAERNAVANKMKGKLEISERQALIEEGKNLKEGLAALEEELVLLTDKLQQEAQCIPNIAHPDVPIGGEDCSALRKMVGSPREFKFPVKDHVQLGKELDLLDFDAAAEVSGSKFCYLKNEAVLLEMGLINWALSEVMKRGFTPLITPEIVRSSVVEKCGFQPRGQNTQVLLTDKLIHRDKGQETIATSELNEPKLPLRKPVNDVAEVKEHGLPIIVPKQEDLSSANSAIFDSDSPHYTDGGHSSLLEPSNSSNIFEPGHSDLLHADEDEEDHLSGSLLHPTYHFPKLEDDVYLNPPVNSCFYSFLVEDQVCCY